MNTINTSYAKRAALFCLAALLLACSRAPEPPKAAPAAHTKAKASKPLAPAQITENQALELLLSALKQHKIADLDCLAFASENDASGMPAAELWEFAAREIHDDRCGGDPAVAPVRDRYQVNSTGVVMVYNVAEAEYVKL